MWRYIKFDNETLTAHDVSFTSYDEIASEGKSVVKLHKHV
jgi:hypothetical protein